MTLHSLNLCCLRVDCILDHNLCPRPSILSCRIGEFWVVLRMPFTGPRGKNGKKWGNVPALGELGNSMEEKNTESSGNPLTRYSKFISPPSPHLWESDLRFKPSSSAGRSLRLSCPRPQKYHPFLRALQLLPALALSVSCIMSLVRVCCLHSATTS